MSMGSRTPQNAGCAASCRAPCQLPQVHACGRLPRSRLGPVAAVAWPAPTTAAGTGPLDLIVDPVGHSVFQGATWVADIVPLLTDGGVTTDDEADATDFEDLPQGYRTADHVAVYDVPAPRPSVTAVSTVAYNNILPVSEHSALLPSTSQTQPAATVPPAAVAGYEGATVTRSSRALRKSRRVVCKVSQYKDPVSQEMDWFKFAATLNEWSTFHKHAKGLKCRHLVQLLGYQKTTNSISIVSEYCSGGDLQSWLDQGKTAARSPPLMMSAAALPRPSQQQQQQQLARTDLPLISAAAATGQSPQLQQPQHLALEAQSHSATAAASHQPHTLDVLHQTLDSESDDEVAAPYQPQQVLVSRRRVWQRAAKRVVRRLNHTLLDLGRLLIGAERGGLGGLVQHQCSQGVAVIDTAWQPNSATLESYDGACQECGSLSCTSAPPPLGRVPQGLSALPAAVGGAGVWPGVQLGLGLQGDARGLHSSRLSEAQVAHVALHVLRGLRTLHLAGLTHGDIKPANVFICSPQGSLSTAAPAAGHGQGREHTLTDRDTFKLGDFGTMRERGRQHLHYFVTGFGFTPEYAAPEALLHGTGRTGPSADMWSLGIMLLQLLLGRLPATAVAMARLHEQGLTAQCPRYLRQYPPACVAMRELSAARVHISPDLELVLRRCLQVPPEQRVQDAMSLMTAGWFHTGVCGQVEILLDAHKSLASASYDSADMNTSRADLATLRVITPV